MRSSCIPRSLAEVASHFRSHANHFGIGMLLLLLGVSLPVSAQMTVGNITGTVVSADGSAVGHAKVTVTAEGTGASRTTTTNSNGEYVAADLNPGTYTVRAEAPGFAPLQKTGVVLSSQQTVRVDVALKVGQVESTVTVTAGAPVIQTDMPSIASTVSDRALTDTSSNLLSTADATGDSGLLFYTTLLPGGSQSGSSFDWSMYGSRGSEAYYNVDGISSNSVLNGNMIGPALPPFGMIQEVQYSAVNNQAEMGQLLNISVITRSGTNKIHGDAFENYATSALDARNYFANSVGRVVEHDFGADVGGPILKNKWFYYASGEFLRQAQPATVDPSVPTTAMRGGDFSSLLQGANPVVLTNPYTGAPFANNVIPTDMLSQAALTWQSRFYPLPNYGPADNYTANFRGTYPQHIYTNRYFFRTDYNFSSKNSMYARVGYVRSSPEVLDSGLPPSLTGYRVQKRHTWQGVLSDTWIINPRLINVAKIGYTHTINDFGGSIAGQPLVNALGITGFQTAPANDTGIPSVYINDFSSPYQLPESAPTEQTVQYIDEATYQRGSHMIKFGGEFRPMQAEQYFYPTYGAFSFDGAYTNFAYADFLLGLPQTTSYTFPRTPEYARLWFLNAFVQDEWRMKPNLTLFYGARYEYDRPAVDKYNTIASFNPATGAIVVPNATVAQQNINPAFPSQIPIQTAAEAGFPARSMRNGFDLALYPRVGFAWQPFHNGSTVIRGGYGIFNDEMTAALFSDLYGGPYGLTVGYTNGITNGAPLIDFQHPINASAGGIGLGAVTVDGFNKNLRNPYAQQFNLTFERNLGFNTGLRLSYIGTRGVKLIWTQNVNQVQASTTAFSQSATPYPDYYGVNLFQNGGYENYNALSAEINRHFRGGLSYEAGLTWAKNLTDDDDTLANGIEGGVTAEDSYNLSRQKGNAEYTPRIDFVSNLIWDLPVGPGKMIMTGNNLASKIAGGWQLSAAYLAQSGDFLTPSFSGYDPTNTNQFGGAAQRLKNVPLRPSSGHSITQWFNPAAFAVPAAGNFGSGAFGSVEGPSMNVLNLALFKSFPVYEQAHVEIRGSFTNVLNHTNFGDPDATITDTSVGQITSTTTKSFGGPRSGLITARLVF